MRKVKPVETEITPSSRSSRKVLISKFQKKSRLRSSHQRYSVRKGVLRSFRKFTWGLQLYQKRLWRKCFPVNFVKFLRTSFSQNTFWRLLLPFFVKYKNAYFEKLRLRHMRRAIVRAQLLQLHIGPNLDITKTLEKKKKYCPQLHCLFHPSERTCFFFKSKLQMVENSIKTIKCLTLFFSLA